MEIKIDIHIVIGTIIYESLEFVPIGIHIRGMSIGCTPKPIILIGRDPD